MINVAVYENVNGSISVVSSIHDDNAYLLSCIPEGLNGFVMRGEDLPNDRYFRDAWSINVDQESVDVDMNQAREVHLAYLRKLRDEKLKMLDIETLKGIDVQAEKQILRDMPQTIDLSVYTSPEALKAFVPAILK